ncbi:MAG: hypothetical protein ABF806_04530, partial [Bifidobacterium psychraerophilum]|uniref:hypothetical protein n=1 Tax=Bifidobacterium psychraerophilum TaxID=218140 RepID=UPI0039ECEB9A
MSVDTRVQIRSNKGLKGQVTDLNRLILGVCNRYRSSPDKGDYRPNATPGIQAPKAVAPYYPIPIRTPQ